MLSKIIVVFYNPQDRDEQVLIRKHHKSGTKDVLTCIKGTANPDELPNWAAMRIVNELLGMRVHGELVKYYVAHQHNIHVYHFTPDNWVEIRDKLATKANGTLGAGVYDLDSTDLYDLIWKDRLYALNLG